MAERMLTLGIYRFPSGNTVTVSMPATATDVALLECIWDTLPLSPADLTYYETVVAPEIYQRAAAAMGKAGGRVLVMQL